MLFGILQAVSNAGYWLLAITAKSLFTMATAVFLENLCGGMGTAAFVALLMTLCNKSFSATQFALLSALAAVGRVYVGPIAGWFVESYGWAWFYLFSIFAALPGLAILLICRETLEFTQKTDTFQLRTNFQNYYKKALHMLGLGAIVLALWLILLISNALEWSSLPLLAEYLLAAGGALALLGIFFGSLLDYLSLRRASKPSAH